jgi:hypothetical protein
MHCNNNPAVGLETRRWLNRVPVFEPSEDEGLELIARVIDQNSSVHPGGMVMDTAISLGARHSAALIAGSISEMFYSVSSLTDDIQDGDTEGYLKDVKLPILLNIQSQLLCLIAVRAADLTEEIGASRTHDLTVVIYQTGAHMLTGQHCEINRTVWNGEIYHRVAELIAGEQFGLYMKLAAFAACHGDVERFAHLGRTYGTLLQYVVDTETSDSRLDIVDTVVLSDIKRRLAAELSFLSRALVMESARKPFDGLIRRCNAYFQQNSSVPII